MSYRKPGRHVPLPVFSEVWPANPHAMFRYGTVVMGVTSHQAHHQMAWHTSNRNRSACKKHHRPKLYILGAIYQQQKQVCNRLYHINCVSYYIIHVVADKHIVSSGNFPSHFNISWGQVKPFKCSTRLMTYLNGNAGVGFRTKLIIAHLKSNGM